MSFFREPPPPQKKKKHKKKQEKSRGYPLGVPLKQLKIGYLQERLDLNRLHPAVSSELPHVRPSEELQKLRPVHRRLRLGAGDRVASRARGNRRDRWPNESQSKPGIKVVYPEPCKEIRRRPHLHLPKGFDYGSNGVEAAQFGFLVDSIQKPEGYVSLNAWGPN